MRIRLLLAVLALLVAGCQLPGGTTISIQRPGTPTATPARTASPTAAPATAPSAPSAPSATPAAPDAGFAAGSTATPAAARPADAALAAALQIFDGVRSEDCRGRNPSRKLCVSLESTPETVQRGISVFNLEDLAGGGAAGVLGKTVTGSWGFWLETQNAYQLLFLPGDLRVCAEGDNLNLRASPSSTAQVVGSLRDQSPIGAEEFTLTEPGVRGSRNGYGWYRVSGQPAGRWAYSKYLSNLAIGNCGLRDAQERGR